MTPQQYKLAEYLKLLFDSGRIKQEADGMEIIKEMTLDLAALLNIAGTPKQ